MAYGTKFRFKAEIDGIDIGKFSEVSGGDVSVDVIEYREGAWQTQYTEKHAGLKKFGNITLKGGLCPISKNITEWIEGSYQAEETKRTLTITAFEADGTSPLASWQVTNAWPVKYTLPDFNATASEMAIETLELACEEIKRIS